MVTGNPFPPSVVVIFAIMSSGAVAGPVTAIYTNARYGYSISYPASLLKQQPEPDAGDGVVFSAVKGTAEFRIYASGTVEGIDDTPETAAKLAEEKCPAHHAAYRVIKTGLAAISCTAGTDILYSKTLLRNGVATTFTGRYPASERATWNAVVAAMARSMTAGHYLN